MWNRTSWRFCYQSDHKSWKLNIESDIDLSIHLIYNGRMHNIWDNIKEEQVNRLCVRKVILISNTSFYLIDQMTYKMNLSDVGIYNSLSNVEHLKHWKSEQCEELNIIRIRHFIEHVHLIDHQVIFNVSKCKELDITRHENKLRLYYLPYWQIGTNRQQK